MHPQESAISDYTYALPPERIAQKPLAQRDQSKLLIYKRDSHSPVTGNIVQDTFSNLDQYLPEETLLVFNDTKVIHARMLFRNEHDAAIEVFLLEPEEPFHDMQLAMFQHGECTWRCLIGNVKKWREDFLSRKIKIDDQEGMLQVQINGKLGDDFLVHFSWQPETLSFVKVLEAIGYVPLPPYIKRRADKDDEERYQTLYAFQDGSVAAPTAGLHFTEPLFEKLRHKNIHPRFITLHVGAGTFKPVKTALIKDHVMHAEQFVVRKNVLETLLSGKNFPIVAIGTTSLRTLESLYWLALKLRNGNESPVIDQWEPYDVLMGSKLSMHDALEIMLTHMEQKNLQQLVGETRLIIAPGYSFKMVNGLITNFHQPQSTLLLLIAAFIGQDWRRVYDYALANDFRFLSYGDGSLLWRE